jgi:enoyl-CoA hydratase/carnithine racemase
LKVRYEAGPDGVATITLDDPDTRNALSTQLLDELLGALGRARDSDAVRCVVLASSHERTFSSGANLGGFGADAALVVKHDASKRFVELFQLIGELGKPSIVKAGGHVLAGALGIALACDLIVASESASFGTPEINVGAFPFMIMAIIYRNVGRKKTNELLLLGERIDAREAERIGIVNKVVPDAELDAAVDEWCRTITRMSPTAIGIAKASFNADSAHLRGISALGFHAAALYKATDEAKEAGRAFREKRDPVFERSAR